MDIPTIPSRRSTRLQNYDYSLPRAYFLTICSEGKKCLFGDIVDGAIHLNDAGQMILAAWQGLVIRFPKIELDEFIVMPNHFHGIVVLRGGDSCDRPSRAERTIHPNETPAKVGRIVQTFKSITTHEYIIGVKQSGWPPFPGKLWQRNYWDHIVRNESDLRNIREYIQSNPVRWELDKLFVP